jgi:hypothetical protein
MLAASFDDWGTVMRVRGTKICRVSSILGAVAVAGVLAATVTGASATTSRATVATAAFALRGSIAGGINTVQPDQTLTFIYTEVNQTTASVPEDLVLTRVTNVRVVGGPPCVLPGGVAIGSDGTSCEPGFIKPGQHASMVITTQVTGVSGAAASARVCLSNQNTGAVGPCRTVSAKIA